VVDFCIQSNLLKNAPEDLSAFWRIHYFSLSTASRLPEYGCPP